MSDEREIVLSQWQTCVEMANNISQRRDTMNNLMVTINLAMITAISITWDIKSVIMCIVGMASSVIWLCFISYFKKLNQAKYDVIISLEKKLPESPFAVEWDRLQKDKDYKEGTKLERTMPTLYLITYFVLVILLFTIK